MPLAAQPQLPPTLAWSITLLGCAANEPCPKGGYNYLLTDGCRGTSSCRLYRQRRPAWQLHWQQKLLLQPRCGGPHQLVDHILAALATLAQCATIACAQHDRWTIPGFAVTVKFFGKYLGEGMSQRKRRCDLSSPFFFFVDSTQGWEENLFALRCNVNFLTKFVINCELYFS